MTLIKMINTIWYIFRAVKVIFSKLEMIESKLKRYIWINNKKKIGNTKPPSQESIAAVGACTHSGCGICSWASVGSWMTQTLERQDPKRAVHCFILSEDIIQWLSAQKADSAPEMPMWDSSPRRSGGHHLETSEGNMFCGLDTPQSPKIECRWDTASR